MDKETARLTCIYNCRRVLYLIGIILVYVAIAFGPCVLIILTSGAFTRTISSNSRRSENQTVIDDVHENAESMGSRIYELESKIDVLSDLLSQNSFDQQSSESLIAVKGHPLAFKDYQIRAKSYYLGLSRDKRAIELYLPRYDLPLTFNADFEFQYLMVKSWPSNKDESVTVKLDYLETDLSAEKVFRGNGQVVGTRDNSIVVKNKSKTSISFIPNFNGLIWNFKLNITYVNYVLDSKEILFQLEV